MLVIFAGLPGVGKSTIARALALDIGATWLRIDTIEHAIAGISTDVADAGYRAAYALAGDNLRLGLTVVADSVNPLGVTREAWREIAREVGVGHLDVEVVCSDATEHRRRVEARAADIPGHVHPTWREVVDREYHPWDRERLAVDTVQRDVAGAVAIIRQAMGR